MTISPRTLLSQVCLWSGWIFALLLLAYLVPKALSRIYVRLPSSQRDDFDRLLRAKAQALATPWGDERPLTIFAGDSHVEFGDWYNYFTGSLSIRNCGLARAKIADVTTLVAALEDRQPQAVVLLCGINDLAAAPSVDTCVELYGKLLSVTKEKLHPREIIVISVPPVRASAADTKSQFVNRKVHEFNGRLAQLCQDTGSIFVNTGALENPAGGLDPGLTRDGLHLNEEGYRRLATILYPVLVHRRDTPQP